MNVFNFVKSFLWSWEELEHLSTFLGYIANSSHHLSNFLVYSRHTMDLACFLQPISLIDTHSIGP